MRFFVVMLIALACLFSTGSVRAGCNYYSGYNGYQKGYSYWPGGYWSGGGGYSSGFYSKGYYKNYDNQIAFVRYKFVVPVLEIGSYALYYQNQKSYDMPAPAAPAATADSKLDRILSAVERTATDVADLKERVAVLERDRGISPPARQPTIQSGADILFSHCAMCHEAAVAKEKGGELVLFVGAGEKAKMATLDKDGKLAEYSQALLGKVKRQLVQKTMPPAKDAEGKPYRPAEPLKDADRQTAIAFVDSLLKRKP